MKLDRTFACAYLRVCRDDPYSGGQRFSESFSIEPKHTGCSGESSRICNHTALSIRQPCEVDLSDVQHSCYHCKHGFLVSVEDVDFAHSIAGAVEAICVVDVAH